ncbi:MAG: TolC family protein, partial [Planctomycetota bacterium]
IPTPELDDSSAPTLTQVVNSVRNNFPLIREAAAARVIASGETLAAIGAFDHKLDGYSNGQPLDFFQNSWHVWGVERDTYWGGKIGAGYKLGRGSFEPWFLERETNDGGELSLKLQAPIGRDVAIDANRAELWRARLERDRVEPFIRAQVIGAVREGSIAYWDWIASGANLRIAEGVLQLGVDRIEFLREEVKAGAKAEIDLTDNRRIIVSRQAKVIDARRKLEQSAAKLSLFLRTATGAPVVLGRDVMPPAFPAIDSVDDLNEQQDIDFAIDNRPELAELSIVRRQLDIALRQAVNETRADVDGGLFFGQDVGNPTASDNKSDFELEATLTVSVPLQRRKALGKLRQLRGKLAQLQAKTQFAGDKVAAEVRIARAALIAAAERVEQTTVGVELARQVQEAERERYRGGQSTLLNLNLREQQAAEAAVALVAAQLDYFVALSDYVAALGLDSGTLDSLPQP